MSMEFFAWPGAEGFFGPDNRKFLYSHLPQLTSHPYAPWGSLPDIVYEKPEDPGAVTTLEGTTAYSCPGCG